MTRTDGTRLVLRRPAIANDTLFGVPRRRGNPSRPAVALSDVQAVAVRRINPITITALALGTGLHGATVVLGATWSTHAD